MDINEFAQNIDKWRSRVATLLQDHTDSVHSFTSISEAEPISKCEAQAHSSSGESVETSELSPLLQQQLGDASFMLSMATEELMVAHEELVQQNEELVRQNEELVVTRQVVDAERQRYQELFEFAPDGYLVTNPLGIVQEANRAAADLLNISQKFLLGKPLLNFIAIDERSNFRTLINTITQNDKTKEWEVSLQTRNSRYVYLALKVAPVCDKAGNVVALRWLLRDITKHKQAELALQQLNEQLKAEIAEREKAEALAREALQAEQELNELKSRFIAMISHEYRTPLTVISSSAQVLQRYGDKLIQHKKNQHLQRIQSSVEHLTQLVNDVLFIHQIEVQNVVVKPTVFNLTEFCQELIEDLRLTTSEAYIITFESQGDCAQVYLDEKLLRQILSNLLTNAIKYSPVGSTIYFSCIGNTKQVTFQIQDEGIGIPAQDLPQLMQPFYRCTNASTIAGTGLGLAIVKKCIDLQRGQIAVESQINIGTKLTVTLPLQKPEP